MKKNEYYQDMFGRSNAFSQNFAAFCYWLFSYPKLILEVFIRREMGERYFTLTSAVIGGALWFAMPIAFSFNSYSASWKDTINANPAYYFFLIPYTIMSAIRYREIKHLPSVYDFERFSLSQGKPFEFFYNIKLFGRPSGLRKIQLYFEPIFCGTIGFMLFKVGATALGGMIMICSFGYFLSNVIATYQANHFIMDKIDEFLCSQDLTETFQKNDDVSPTGVPMFAKKPSTEMLRKDLAEAILNYDDDAIEAV